MTFSCNNLDKLLEVCRKVTPETWVHLYPLADWEANKPGGLPRRIVAIENQEEGQIDILEDISEADDAEFIVLARTALPELAQQVIKLNESFILCDKALRLACEALSSATETICPAELDTFSGDCSECGNGTSKIQCWAEHFLTLVTAGYGKE